jgi:putative endonuclease
MAKHNITGALGEKLATTWFEEKGYTILHTNWRHKNLEVDIIATKNNMLHFIEVKTVTTLRYGNPEEKVSAKKIKNLIDASAEFLHQQPEWKRIQEVEYYLIEDVYE